MKSKVLLCTMCTMKTTSWLLVIICTVLVHSTDLTNCAPTEIISPGNDHVTGNYPTATIAPTTMTMMSMSMSMTTMPMTSAKSWSSQKPSRSKHITKSNLYKKPSKDRGGWAKVPFLSPTLVPTGYDVEKDISRHKEALVEVPVTTTTTIFATTIDTVVDNVNGPKDYTNKNSTNTSALRHFDSFPLSHTDSLLEVSDILSTNANGDEHSGKDIDFISDSRTTKADETYATTEGYHAKAAAVAASSTTTMPTSRVENPVSNMEAIPKEPTVQGVVKSIVSSDDVVTPAVTYTPYIQRSKSMPVNASVSFSSPSTTMSIVSPPTPKLPSDVGHDGVKVTKKKQLFDKHFIAASNPSGSLHSSMRKDNPWPSLSKNKPTKSNFAGTGGGKKLMEVPNGYLGPIMMKEKTFSVSHVGKKPKPKPSLVEQKLKDKKLVEIIAPTALMEPISKAKNSQPDFVAIDNMMATAAMATTTMKPTTTTTTTTEGGIRSSTEIPMLSGNISKKKEIESETATTYFLVVTQDGQAPSKEIARETVRPPVYPEMEPLNSGEIETTLREIYAEVINAMEGGSRSKSTSTENNSNPTTTNLPPNPPETGSGDPLSNGKHSSFDSDHQQFLENGHQTENVKEKQVRPFDNDERKASHKDQMIHSTDSSLDTEGTPLTLNIFDQSSLKQATLATINPPIDESPIPVEQFNSSATKVDKTTIKDHVTLSSTYNTLPKSTLGATTKIETSSIESPSSSKPPETTKAVKQISSTPNTPSESPLLLVTKSSLKTESSHDTESIVNEKVLKKNVDTFPATFSTLKLSNPTSLSILTDELIVSDRSLMIDYSSATTQSSIDLTQVPQTVKPLLPVLPEATTIKNRLDEYSSITTESSVKHVISHSTHSNTKNHLFTDLFKTTTKNLLPLLQTTTVLPSTDKPLDLVKDTLTTSEITPKSKVTSTYTDILTDTTTPKKFLVLTTIANHDSIVQDTSSSTTESSSPVQHDSSTISPLSLLTTKLSNPTSSSKSVNLEKSTMSLHQKLPVPTQNSEPSESKISDIQIEVYDSTLEPIVAATNFKHSTDISSPSSSRTTTTKHSSSKDHTQERFTQYIVDKSSDFATQESSSIGRTPGKPEPAAIEIHINVSEGFGNESEDLEFLYRQSDFRKFPSKKLPNSLKPFDVAPQNETSNEAAEEIVVEIIDGNSNSTENSASRENLNVNPVFTFRSDDDSQVELKNVKYYPEDRPKDSGAKSSDDFFVPHVGQHPSSGNKPLMDRDSDTIFYISNTEVKVGESLPTANTYDTQMKKSRLESQFFPANYEEHKKPPPQRYEEDIILSPPKNGPLKVIRRPLDISYVGESIMEVEQVTLTTTITPPVSALPPGSTPDVIIEPAVLPEMAIGVPVIGELPPQIELKEIDYMPNFDGNKEESSIQYGGDLIDEGGAMGVGFDMDSYPLGNLGMGNRNSAAAISSQMLFNHRVNHLKKDILSADIGGSSETADGNDLLRQTNDSLINGTGGGEKMGNATAYSVMEDRSALKDFMYLLTLRTLVFIGLYTLIPVILAFLLIFIWRDYNRKYKRNPFNAMGRNSSTDPLDAEKGNGGDGDGDGLETPEEDISRDTRVTKMHYNNSEKDGVFVVEVSRGADSKIMPGSPVSDPTEKRPFNIDADVKIVQSDTQALLSNHEKVQVHQPPASSENLINHDEIDTNHLHQIDEVDEFEECPRFAKNSNTGLSQSDLSSSSSVDSNKRYSYGNQELYTIEQQDYTTPSPIATKAPHPHAESKHTQPQNHNDDNGHPENGHCLEKSPPPAPKCNSSIPPKSSSDKVHDMNGHGSTVVESKPKITAALLKQDTVVVNEVTNGSSHDNGNEDVDDKKEDDEKANDKKANEKATSQNPTIENKMSSEPAAAVEIKTLPDYSSANTENGFDSIISLPDPPSTEEIKQMNDIILMETNQLDSLPPPPPPATIDNHQHHNGNGNVPFVGMDQNGDSHSIVSSTESPTQTPTKVMKPLVPPTITVADTSALTTTDIPVHTNGNCMTGHATAIAVEVSGSS